MAEMSVQELDAFQRRNKVGPYAPAAKPAAAAPPAAVSGAPASGLTRIMQGLQTESLRRREQEAMK